MSGIVTHRNHNLEVVEGNKACWNHAHRRRFGFHNLHRIARYGLSFRAARVLSLQERFDVHIGKLRVVWDLTSHPCFSAMVVVRGQDVLFEKYAPDFGSEHLHSIQSITKTTMHLVVGKLIEQGVLDLSRRVSDYVPEIGSGYADATVQQVLNMDVANEYSEDFADPKATYYRHEEAMGWRLPRGEDPEETQRRFIARIKSADIVNRSGYAQYKDANTDVIGWVVERASGRPLRAFLADIVDAAGLAGTFCITADREGFPTVDGGACLSARDLARYMSIFVRKGRSCTGEEFGSAALIETSLTSGVPLARPYEGMRYSNHLMVAGRTLGHGGWCGQYAMANLETAKVGIFFSVATDDHAATPDYKRAVVRMLEEVTGTS